MNVIPLWKMYVIIIWNKLNLIQNTQLSVFKGEQGMNNSS